MWKAKWKRKWDGFLCCSTGKVNKRGMCTCTEDLKADYFVADVIEQIGGRIDVKYLEHAILEYDFEFEVDNDTVYYTIFIYDSMSDRASNFDIRGH